MKEELKDLAVLKNAPAMFQEYLPPKEDLRVTVVGRETFSARSNSSHLDWRTDASVRWQSTSLPRQIANSMRKTMRLLGLSMGSFDLRIDEQGRPVFLEINPNGQFLFLEVANPDLQISAAIARLLLSSERQGRSAS